jgi:hypothetical protein
MLRGLSRDYWVAVAMLAVLLALVGLVLRDYGVGLPEFPAPSAQPTPILPPLHATEFERLFPGELERELRQDPDRPSPFFTAHFQPPKPKPPTTRKVNMTYLGLLESSEGRRQAFLRIDNETRNAGVGESIIADLGVADMDLRSLSLTNSAAETNVLQFNVSKAVEVPIP